MTEAQRYDVVELSKPQRFPNGWLRADAFLTRPGVFEYLEADGRIRRELRTPEEVFHADSLSTLQLVPVTLRHPRGPDGQKILLDSRNTKFYSVGHAGEQVSREGDRVRNTLMITDDEAVAAVDGGVRQVSCGYRCDCDETPGETKGIKGLPDGLKYDAVQKRIRYNHVALEPIGRAGPDIGIRLDTGDAVQVVSRPITPSDPRPANPDPSNNPGGPVMANVKIRIDGVDFEAPEQLTQAITAREQKHAQEIEASRAEVKTRTDAVEAKGKELEAKAKDLEKEKARADAAEAEAKKAKDELTTARKPETISEAVKARVSLEREASAVLGAEAKFDGKDESAIKHEVVAKVYPDVKLDGKGVDYVQALYERALATSKDASQEATDRAAVEAALGKTGKSATQERTDAVAEAQKKQSEAWKQPLTGSKDKA